MFRIARRVLAIAPNHIMSSSRRRPGPIRRVADVLVGVNGLVERPRCNHDRQGLWVPACAGTTESVLRRITSLLTPGKRHRCPQIPSREWEFQKTSLDKKRGRRNAERRTLVTAAACFPDRRETEAHGNASQRSVAAFFKTSVRSSGDLAHGDFAPLPVPVQPHQWQSPIMGPDGNPRPPECAGHDPPPAGAAPTPTFQSVLK